MSEKESDRFSGTLTCEATSLDLKFGYFHFGDGGATS